MKASRIKKKINT